MRTRGRCANEKAALEDQTLVAGSEVLSSESGNDSEIQVLRRKKMAMVTCTACEGKKKIKVKFHEGSKVSYFEMECVTCNGTGKISEEQKKAEEEFWCKCSDGENVTYYPDGTHPKCSKHCWACNICGGIVQVG